MNDQWLQPVSIRPVGVVLSPLKNFDQVPRYDEESVILMRGDLLPALAGLEHFSHLHVLYRQHRRGEWKKRAGLAEDVETLTMPNVGEPTCKGVYTSRSPARPSGIGSCVAELLGRDENKLQVRGLDAVDGTPVLDIKIYIARYDCFPNAISPLHWCQKTELLDTSRLLHWETMSVSLTLGMRAGQRALKELQAGRAERKIAHVQGGNFFAEGVEGITGCSVIHGSMTFEEKSKSVADWVVRADSDGRSVTIRMKDRPWESAGDVLAADDELLFQSVEVAVHDLRV
jgi:formylmethanofuran dehydrogenase subunit E